MGPEEQAKMVKEGKAIAELLAVALLTAWQAFVEKNCDTETTDRGVLLVASVAALQMVADELYQAYQSAGTNKTNAVLN